MNPNPLLYQINARVWLNRLSRSAGRRVTLAEVPDGVLDRIRDLGFDWVWLLGVWRIGEAGRKLALSDQAGRRRFQESLPDLKEEDISGSCFAVTGYQVAEGLGGDEALARLRDRLRAREIRLILDFIPNHVALDHPWVLEHPEYFIQSSVEGGGEPPAGFVRLESGAGVRHFAHGRDPNFAPWSDTLQLNHGEPALQGALRGELRNVAAKCDGVRCDMAMLVTQEVFRRTWGIEAGEFWPKAIATTREVHAGFTFVAEVYWGLEGALLDQGFDYCYDKGLYDRLRSGDVQALKSHLGQGWKDPTRAVRFIENHDEPRGASTFEPGRHQCAAVTTYLSPGMRLFHEGQLEGHRIRVPMQLVRAPEEPVNPALAGFYGELVALLKEPSYRRGRCRLLDLATDWPGSAAGDAIVAWSWDGPDGERRVIVVNPSDSECEARMLLPRSGLNVRGLRLRGGPDLALRPIEAAVQQEGVLLLRLGAWEFCVLEWTP